MWRILQRRHHEPHVVRWGSGIALTVQWTALTAGAALLLAYLAAQWHFARLHDTGIGLFETALAAVQPQNTTEEPSELGSFDWQTIPLELQTKPLDVAPLRIEATAQLSAMSPDTSLWAPARVSAYRAEDYLVGSPRAVLRIPSIAMEVPVYEGTTESNLNRGAAWIGGTAPLDSTGNIGLAAHRDGYFRALRDIAVGDRIELQTLRRTQIYSVQEIRIVAPDEVQVLAPTQGEQLTLVTCYPFYRLGPAPKRFVVRARPAEMQPEYARSEDQRKDADDHEQADERENADSAG